MKIKPDGFKLTGLELSRQKNKAIENFKDAQDKLLTAITNYDGKVKNLEQYIRGEIPIEKLIENFPETKDIITNKVTAERYLNKVSKEKKRIEAGFKKSIAQAKIKLEEALARLNLSEGSDKIG